MMGIHPALKCFNKRKCRFLTPCFYVCKRPVSISVKRGFYARKIPLLENSDSIQEFLIFLHSFARVPNTTIKGAPAGMGESARSGNGYPAAMCCLNCIVNDEFFFLSLQYHRGACSSIPASSPIQCVALRACVRLTLTFWVS